MSLQEHALSQSVIEFLITKLNWLDTPNADAEAGPSVERGPPKNPHPQAQAQAHVQAPLPRLAYNAQFQQSQMQPQPQQQQQPRSIPQERRHSTSRYGSDVDDVMVIPNSDEEYDDDWIPPMQGGGEKGLMVGRGMVRSEDRKGQIRMDVDKSGVFFVLSFYLVVDANFFVRISNRSNEFGCCPKFNDGRCHAESDATFT